MGVLYPGGIGILDMLVLWREKNRRNVGEKPIEQGVNQNKLSALMAPDGNQTRATLLCASALTNTPSLLPGLHVVSCYMNIHSKVGFPLFSG